MMAKNVTTFFLVGCIAGTGGVLRASDYSIAVDGAHIIAEPFATPYIGAHCFDGTSAYCIVRAVPVVQGGEWGSNIVRINNIDTTPTTTLLVSNAQWKSFLGLNSNGTPCEQDLYMSATILPGNRIAVIGDHLQFLDHARTGLVAGATNCTTGSFSMDAVFRVNKNTGQMSEFVSNAAFKTFLGMQGAENPKFNTDAIAFTLKDEMVVYEEVTHNLIQIDPSGNLKILVSRQEFKDYYGYEPLDAVSAIAFDSQNRLYWGLKGGVGGGGGAIHRRNCDGTVVQMISQQDIWAVTGTSAHTNFFDIYVGPDDNLYFYEGGSGSSFSILYFNVNDPNLPHTSGNPLPTGVISFYLTSAQLTAGPAGARFVSAFNSRGTNLTWSTGLSPLANDVYRKPLVGPLVTPSLCGCAWFLVGDFNKDRRVNSDDFPIFAACATGSGVKYDGSNLPAGCTVDPDCDGLIPPDLDEDGDVDMTDFAAFQRLLTIE